MKKRTTRGLALFGLATLLAFTAGCTKNSSGPTGVDTTAPTVSSTNPTDGATGVAAITATFSESMTISSISATTFSVSGPDGVDVPGTVSYWDLDNTATFTPTGALTSFALYTATITTGVHDVSGNAMVVNKTWNFTTLAADIVPTEPNDPSRPRTD